MSFKIFRKSKSTPVNSEAKNKGVLCFFGIQKKDSACSAKFVSVKLNNKNQEASKKNDTQQTNTIDKDKCNKTFSKIKTKEGPKINQDVKQSKHKKINLIQAYDVKQNSHVFNQETESKNRVFKIFGIQRRDSSCSAKRVLVRLQEKETKKKDYQQTNAIHRDQSN